jgi:hypothetical protein
MVAKNARQRTTQAPPRLLAHSPAAQHVARQRLLWYVGLGLMAIIEVIDWPVAIGIAVGHEIAYRARTAALRELAKGIEAGA